MVIPQIRRPLAALRTRIWPPRHASRWAGCERLGCSPWPRSSCCRALADCQERVLGRRGHGRRRTARLLAGRWERCQDTRGLAPRDHEGSSFGYTSPGRSHRQARQRAARNRLSRDQPGLLRCGSGVQPPWLVAYLPPLTVRPAWCCPSLVVSTAVTGHAHGWAVISWLVATTSRASQPAREPGPRFCVLAERR